MGDQKSHQTTKARRGSGPAEGGGPRRGRNRQAGPEPLVNLDELRDLIALLKENQLAEFELEREGFRIHLRQGVDYPGAEGAGAAGEEPQTPPPVTAKGIAAFNASGIAAAPVHPGASAETAASEDLDLKIIPSPIVGTFYRSPSPTAESFVKIGSVVGPETVVCIIEAMKLMNEIQAETGGEVVKIYVENGQPVEYGQPLFGIRK
jgi:acetyl-CoA carboxylase biotin carboxyl carrier protein